MIKIAHSRLDSKFYLKPETMDDQEALIHLVYKDSPDNVLFEKLIYQDELWSFPEQDIDQVNKCLVPLKHLLAKTDSFNRWLTERSFSTVVPAVIRVMTVYSSITPGNQPLPLTEIDAATRYFNKAAVNSKRYKEGKWDGIVHLLRMRDLRFPTGLVGAVVTELEKANVAHTVHYAYNRRVPPEFALQICDGITPDPDQEEAVEAAWAGGRGIVKAPTGFGKTAILAKRLVAKFGVPTLFVANKKALLDDAQREFVTGIVNEDGTPVSVTTIKDGEFCGQNPGEPVIRPISAQVVVATIQSLAARIDDPRTADVLQDWLKYRCKFVMVDECQAVGTTIWDTIMHQCYAPYRILLSATPRRTDGATIKLMADSGNVLYATTAEKQIEQGRLCEVEILYNIYDHGLYNEDDKNLAYADCYESFIATNVDRNQKAIIAPTLAMIAEGRHVLVLIQQIEHGHALRRMFLDAGLPDDDIRFVWGGTTDKARRAAIEEFRKGDFKVMIGSTIFDAGVNIPIISGVVLGGAGNSDITLIQRIGRGVRNFDYNEFLGYTPDFIRQYDGKKVTKVFDVIDKNIKFFHRQSIARYYNASAEFGADRVRIVGGSRKDLRRKTTSQRRLEQDLDQHSAQIAMLQEFMRK